MQNVAKLIGASVQIMAVSIHQSIEQKAEIAMEYGHRHMSSDFAVDRQH